MSRKGLRAHSPLNIPHFNRAIPRPTNQLRIGQQLYTNHLIRMLLQRPNTLARTQIPHLYRLIIATANQTVRWAQFQTPHPILMPNKRSNTFPCLQIPNFNLKNLNLILINLMFFKFKLKQNNSSKYKQLHCGFC